MPAPSENQPSVTTAISASGSLRGLLAPADVSVAVLDRDGFIVGVNRGWKEFARENDADPDKVGPGVNYFDICRSADRAGVEIGQRLERLAAGECRAFVTEYPCHAPDRERWMSMHAGRVGGDDFQGIVVTHVDITDSVRDRVRYGREHALLTRILDDVPKGVFWKDAGLRFEGANRAFRELAELDPERDIAGLTDRDLRLSRGLVHALADAQRQVIETGAEMHNAEFPLTLNGRRRLISASVSPLQDDEGVVTGLVGVLSDITETVAKTREAHDLRRYRMLAHVAAAVAHELNTPAQYVRGNLDFLEECFSELREWLETHASGPESESGRYPAWMDDIPAALADAAQGLEQISRSVRSLLQYAPYPEAQASPVDINLGLRGLVPVLKNKWPHLSAVMLDLDERLPVLRQSGGDIIRAVYALLDNAGEATVGTTDPRILLTTRCAGEQIEILVSDTGPGIPRALRNRIFQPFFSTRDNEGRRGFGLSKAREVIVERYGGSLTVQSAEEGGATFRVVLPVDEQHDGALLSAHEPETASRQES